MIDLWSVLRAGALKRSDEVALWAPGLRPLSFQGLAEQVRQAAEDLRAAGVGAQDRVALALPGDAVMATAFLAVAACAVCVPVNPAQPTDELRRALSQFGAGFLVLRADEHGAVRQVADELGLTVLEIEAGESIAGTFAIRRPRGRSTTTMTFNGPRATALVLLTSGSTARPKRVPLTHANLLASARGNIEVLALGPADRCLGAMPLFHNGGLISAWLSTLVAGGSYIAAGPFDPDTFFDLVAQFDPTWYAAGPTVHQAVLERSEAYRIKARRHRFRVLRSASAPLPAATRARLVELFQAPLAELYGMTEAGRIAGTPVAGEAPPAGSVGRPVSCEVVIRGEDGRHLAAGQRGEIMVRGAVVMAGYEDDADANRAAFDDGWFRTGDLGRLDADGYLYIEGRLKDIVNRGGQKVSPAEVDRQIGEHPAVAQACAFPVPHPTLLEDLVAAVVLHPGQRLDAAELRHYLFERLVPCKVPARVLFVEQIPKGPTGKVQRHLLADQLQDALQPQHVALQTDTEALVASLWSEVLQCPLPGARDNFFAIGGDSLRGLRVVAQLNEELDLDLAPTMLFRHPELCDFAEGVDRARAVHDALERELIDEISALDDDEIARLLADEPDTAPRVGPLTW